MWVLALGLAAVLSAGEAVAQDDPVIPAATATAIKVTPTTVDVDEGDSKTYTVGLNGTLQAGATVSVTVAATLAADDDNADFRVDADDDLTAWTHTFTAPGTLGTDDPVAVDPVTVTLTALPDGNATNGRNVLTFSTTDTQDHDNDTGTDARGYSQARLTIIENDDDDLGVTVSERALTVREGDMIGETYTVVLGSMPTHPVTVTVAVTSEVNANIEVDQSSLEFSTTNWDDKQTVTVTAINDSNTIGGSATIKHTTASDDVNYNKITVSSISVKELDNVRTITLSTSADTVDEGKMVTITATLGTGTGDDTPATLPSDVTVKLSRKASSTAEKSGDFKVGNITIATNSTAGSVTLEALHDADEDDEKLTLTASADGPAIFTNPRQEVSVEIMDDDTYTLEADKMEVDEGKEVTLTVKVAPSVAAAAAPTKVMIDLYRASGATVKVAEGQEADPEDDKIAMMDEGETTAKFTLTTAKDANDSNDEVVVARAMVGSAVVGDPVEIMVLDTQAAAEYTLSVDADAIGEADGEASVMLKVMTNKAVAADTTLTLAVDAASTAMAPDDYSIMSADMMMVTVAKGETMGMTTLMVTPVADAMDEANETIVLTAWMDDAQVGNAATLTIIDGDSTTFTLSGPSDMNLVEGFEYEIMVTASTAVKADTSVMIMAGDASTASADDYMVEDIMIMAGETMGRTKLMVKSDDMPDGGTDGGMTEKLVLYGMVGNMRTNELSFYLWDLAVPALPVIAQLLLAGLMAIGGYRRYRRR